jgi:pimeloyl-ACP methyl ester carboxylesterase
VRPRPGPRALIYFGGNADNVAPALPLLARSFPDRAIYLMHYRGYGGSTGTPTEAALHADARALFDQVHAAHPDVLVIGRSLGSGVAVRLASERPVSQLLLVTPYDSIAGLAEALFPWLPVSWIMMDKFDSGRWAPRIQAPTTVLLAETDRTVPHWSTERLLRRFAPGVLRATRTIPGANHGNIIDTPGYAQALQQLTP